MHDAAQVTFDQVVSLYERAGFIYPEKKSCLSPHWEEIQETWTKLLATRNWLFRFNYKTRNEALSSSICVAQYTDRTWLIQHAVGVRDPGGVLGNLLEVCEWAVSNPYCRYVRFLYRPTSRWPSLLFGRLTPRLREESYETHVYNYYTGIVDQEIRLAPTDGLDIACLKPNEYESFEGDIRKHHSGLFVDAKGLRSDEIDVPHARLKYAAEGLMRQRTVLAARREDDVVGYSVLDHSSLGINLSFLLNAFTITMLRHDDAAEHGLVGASVNHYRSLGRRFVVGLSEGAFSTAFNRAGLETKRQYAEMLVCKDGNFAGAVEHFTQFYRGMGAR